METLYEAQAFILSAAKVPWGDYGHVLTHGMSKHLNRRNGHIQLERTGPFIPPITFPGVGDLVVTDAIRRELEGQDFSGLQFSAIDLVHIVNLNWETWDMQAKEPQMLPPGGEPEAYILKNAHDPASASALGELWEGTVRAWGRSTSELIGRRPIKYRVTLTSESDSIPDFFRADGARYIFVSLRAREWLERAVGSWVAFERVTFTSE